jgi:hypothetical protein
MTYQEQIKDPRWQKKRLEIMELDHFTCCCCRATDKTLNVHHRWYDKGKMIWEYDNICLITLCEDCHKNEHNDLEKIQVNFMKVVGMETFTTYHYRAIAMILDKINITLQSKDLMYYDYGKTWNIEITPVNKDVE